MNAKKPRLFALTLAFALLAALCGCSGGPPPTFRIGLALYSGEDTFISSVSSTMEQLSKAEEQARGLKINISIADATRSQMVQNEQVDRFLKQGYDLIFVNIVDRTAAAVIVDKAAEAGTPVVFFNREPVQEDLDRWEQAFYVGAPGEQAGRMQGELLLSNWRERKAALDRSGDGILQYVMLEGEPGHQDTLLRTEYSVQTLKEGGVPLERLGSARADWQRGKAGEKMRQLLEELGPDAVEAVLANNDDMALGAIDACLDFGIPVEELPLVLGVDATAEAEEAISKGLLAGTVRNDAEGQASAMMDFACALLDGTDPSTLPSLREEHYIWLQYEPVQ